MNRKKRILFVCVLSLMLVFTAVLSAGGAQEEADSPQEKAGEEDPGEMVFMTSEPGGTWYPVGVACTEIWHRELGYDYSIAPGGGEANAIGLEGDQGQFGMTLSTTISSDLGEKGPSEYNTRVIANLAPSVVQYFAYKDSGINEFQDLKGKVVGVKPRHFSAHAINIWITELNGMSFDDFGKAEPLEKKESIDLLKDGHMDAILWIGNPVDANLVDAATVKPLQIIELSEEVRQKIIQANPGYVPYTIPVDNYRGVTEPIKTVSMPTVLITNKFVSEEAMYKMTKALAENLNYLGDTDANYKTLKPEDLYYDFGVAYHEGSLRYYREIGLVD